MKKSIAIVIMAITIISFQQSSHAEDVGVGEVIFEEVTATKTVEHGFFMNEISYEIIKLHLLVAEKDLETADYEWEALATIKTLEELTKTDVIQLLNLSIDKEKTLNDYLNSCNQNLQKWDAISSYMRQEMELIKSDMESCIQAKNLSNSTYFDAIDIYDQTTMDASHSDAVKYEICAIENRIEYNVQGSIVRKLVFYLGLLQKKYDVLFAKQDIVAKNYDIFRDGILPDLNQIDELLKQYTF